NIKSTLFKRIPKRSFTVTLNQHYSNASQWFSFNIKSTLFKRIPELSFTVTLNQHYSNASQWFSALCLMSPIWEPYMCGDQEGRLSSIYTTASLDVLAA